LFNKYTVPELSGYFEEEAVISYTQYLEEIDNGLHENVLTPQIAVDYWNLKPNARLRDVVQKILNDEAGHRNVNHEFANSFK
jgi:ubiquinol oxidase